MQLVQPLRDQKMGGKVWFGSTSVGRRDGKKVFTLVNLHLEGRQASSRQQSKENRRKIQTNTVHIHTPKTSTNHHTNILTLCFFFCGMSNRCCAPGCISLLGLNGLGHVLWDRLVLLKLHASVVGQTAP